MQLIVKIDEKVYKAIKAHLDCGGYYDSDCFNAIWNGVPIPEGHGRLIDADELESRMKIGYCIVRDAPTIIEADKAEGGE